MARFYNHVDDAAPVKTIGYSYNDVGSLTGYNDGTTSAVYTYDALQRKQTEAIDYGPFTLSHAYDYYANNLKKSYTGPNGTTRSYSYDSANRPTALLLPNGKEIAFTGYIWNRPEHITFPGGATLNFNYNGLQQQTAFLAADPGGASLYESNDIHALDGQIVTKQTLHGLY